MHYRIIFTSGATLVTEQPSETEARERAAFVSPRATIHSVHGHMTRDEASRPTVTEYDLKIAAARRDLENSSFRMGPKYRAEIARLENERAALT